jgi:hypothetical protein
VSEVLILLADGILQVLAIPPLGRI